jgi:zinc D-Ala-D-Ala carboxypeptidase
MTFLRFALLATLIASTGAQAPAIAPKAQLLCPGQPALPSRGPDGRLMNHFPYSQANAEQLASVPKGFGSGNCQLVHRDMIPALTALVAAARADPKVGNSIMGLSCFRSVERQRGLFCSPAKLKARGYVGQAKWVAPPGYSEHATGFAIDFAARNVPGCQASTCFSGTAVSRWLAAHARDYGFELSFPSGNAQGVSYEPWHWRWIGKAGDPANANAKIIFAATKAQFPR